MESSSISPCYTAANSYGQPASLYSRDTLIGSGRVADKPIRFGIKVAQMTGTYDGIQDAWLEADRLGFDTAWGHDHLLNQNDHTQPEEEGWTILAALLALSKQIKGGLMVTANT